MEGFHGRALVVAVQRRQGDPRPSHTKNALQFLVFCTQRRIHDKSQELAKRQEIVGLASTMPIERSVRSIMKFEMAA